MIRFTPDKVSHDTWLEQEGTRLYGKQAREQQKNAMRALLAAARKSTDPAVRGRCAEYDAITTVANFMEGHTDDARDE